MKLVVGLVLSRRRVAARGPLVTEGRVRRAAAWLLRRRGIEVEPGAFRVSATDHLSDLFIRNRLLMVAEAETVAS